VDKFAEAFRAIPCIWIVLNIALADIGERAVDVLLIEALLVKGQHRLTIAFLLRGTGLGCGRRGSNHDEKASRTCQAYQSGQRAHHSTPISETRPCRHKLDPGPRLNLFKRLVVARR